MPLIVYLSKLVVNMRTDKEIKKEIEELSVCVDLPEVSRVLFNTRIAIELLLDIRGFLMPHLKEKQ